MQACILKLDDLKKEIAEIENQEAETEKVIVNLEKMKTS